jgi:hypothetical protein
MSLRQGVLDRCGELPDYMVFMIQLLNSGAANQWHAVRRCHFLH